MKKRILSSILCVVCAFSLLVACNDSKEIDLPLAELNENITKPEGKFLEVNGKPTAQGGLSSLGENYLKIMIEGTEYEFKASAEVMRKIGIFNKDENNLKIKIGTFLMLTYEMQGDIYFATDIEIVESN